MPPVTIRRATPEDAEGIVHVLQVIAAEKIYSKIEQVWSVQEEQQYLASLSAREAFHVAINDKGGIVGFQSLDLWSSMFPATSHVAQLGTFLLPEWRGLGIGRRLWEATEQFARTAAYEKLAITVRASNSNALEFYRRLGFQECGRFTRQIRIAGVTDDEVLLELFFAPPKSSFS